MKKFLLFVFALILISSLTCSAHPGRTDKNGGHVNKATGEYHYHNSDGTVTIAPKPEKTTEPVENKPVQSEAVNQVENKITTITVNDIEKPVTDSVSKIIKEEQQSAEPTKADKVIKTRDENGNIVIYVPKSTPYSGINNFVWYLLISFAVIGWISVSPIICILLNKIEEKNKSWRIILHVPYLLFWLPSVPGKILYMLYNHISPKKDKNDDDYDDDEYYEEI